MILCSSGVSVVSACLDLPSSPNIACEWGFLHVLSPWEFMTPVVLSDVLKLSWKEYGSRGEKSSEGPMNFRGNVLKALLGYCHEHSIKVSGYHAGRLKEPEQDPRLPKTDNSTLHMSNLFSQTFPAMLLRLVGTADSAGDCELS